MISWEMYAAIAAMAVLTYATRAVPFLIMQKSKWLSRLGSGRFAILGPALLTSTTAVVLYSEIHKAPSAWHIGAYVVAVLIVGIALKATKNIGIAMLLGIVAYGVGMYLI
ncbi:MAG: AzlD domain-containing protein [Pelistega sp.]|nr:AzlD domain-containing protein [Pelistega sp.]